MVLWWAARMKAVTLLDQILELGAFVRTTQGFASVLASGGSAFGATLPA
jgi:hypothetical protein